MIFYLTFRQVNERIREIREQTGIEPTMNHVLLDLYRRGRGIEHASNQGLISYLANCNNEVFLREKDNLYIECDSRVIEYQAQHPELNRVSDEVLRLTDKREDVFLHFRFMHTSSRLHPHPSFFEISYVYAGVYSFTFENREYLMRPGDLCIISPNSRHMIREVEQIDAQTAAILGKYPDSALSDEAVSFTSSSPDDYFLIQQYMSNDALHSTLISLLSSDNIVSNFFKEILTNRNCNNFLLLSTGGSDNFPYIQRIAKDIFLEQFKYDDYSPTCNINLLMILFSNVLRSHRNSYQLYSGGTDIDFVPILNYLEQNYRTTTLAETARLFHYSPSHLSACIKQITGKTYTEMIRGLKMKEAENYLEHSKKSIEEISLLVGYKTVDHFSRAFRQHYGMPPSQYRKEHKKGKMEF